MRGDSRAADVRQLFRELGNAVQSPGRILISGGASAVLYGWRETTIDVDLHFEVEPTGAFEAIARLKNQLDMNIELAWPMAFIPGPAGWENRCEFISHEGKIDFLHCDFVSQALSKILRAHTVDKIDVAAMWSRNLINETSLSHGFASIKDRLLRFPGIDESAFEKKLQDFLQERN